VARATGHIFSDSVHQYQLLLFFVYRVYGRLILEKYHRFCNPDIGRWEVKTDISGKEEKYRIYLLIR
jgi:hypothetical protein